MRRTCRALVMVATHTTSYVSVHRPSRQESPLASDQLHGAPLGQLMSRRQVSAQSSFRLLHPSRMFHYRNPLCYHNEREVFPRPQWNVTGVPHSPQARVP
jgi:hypothetical protein